MIKNVSVNNFDIKGLNLFVSPLVKDDSELLRAVNVETYPHGAKSKRMGYDAFLGTPDASQVNSLFQWGKNDGTSMWLYRASGSALYYSTQGTGAWTLCGGGTITAGGYVGHAVLGDTLIVGDGAGSTRHTTNGTSFTNTTLAPVSPYFAQYQNRIYASGTASDLFYSSANDATNWALSGTSDSSSIKMPGAGKNSQVFTSNDRLIVTKNSNLMFKWDGYNVVDTSTTLGPSSPQTVDQIEGYNFWVNRLGLFGYGGVLPELLSNAIQPLFYNDAGGGAVGTRFDTLPGVSHRYDYFASLGTVTDDITNIAVPDCVMKYDVRHSEFLNWSFYDLPTAWCSYKDSTGNQQLIFGNASGQCFKLNGDTTTDNGNPITSVMEFTVTMGQPQLEKKWRWWTGIFNPGCEAKIAVATGDTYVKGEKKWIEMGDAHTGVVNLRFPEDCRGRLLFIKIYESSKTTGFTFYGYSVNADLIIK